MRRSMPRRAAPDQSRRPGGSPAVRLRVEPEQRRAARGAHPGAGEAGPAVGRRRGRAELPALLGLIAQRADLLPHRLVALRLVVLAGQLLAERQPVARPGVEIDEVLDEPEIAPRLVLRSPQRAHLDGPLVVL